MSVKAVPLDEIYRVIAGHSNYHGDDILSALTCIAEGKDVKPIRPIENNNGVKVKAEATLYWKRVDVRTSNLTCSACGSHLGCREDAKFCPECGAKMDGEAQ